MTNNRPFLLITLATLILVFGSCVAFAWGNETSVEDRLQKIEMDVENLSRSVFQNSETMLDANGNIAAAPTPQGLAAMEIRLQDLESQIQTLTGQMEEHSRTLMTLQDSVTALENLSIASAEKGVPATTPPSLVPPAAGMTGTLPVQSESSMAYEAAYALMKQGDTTGAAKGFEEFLATWGEDALAPNAQYWLGESLYAKGDYTNAAKAFAMGYQKWPKADKTPDMLLKLAMTLAQMGSKTEACTTIKKLQADYPTAAMPILERAEKEASRIGC